MANPPKIDPRIRKLCDQVTAKRARTVIDHIVKYGQITTEELQELGYDHAPRAARDVREQGIPLDTVKVRSTRTGRSIAAYRFGNPDNIVGGRIGGRKALPKWLKAALIERDGCADRFTGQSLPETALTIDHRIPYEVSGDSGGELDPADFMLLDGSSQRSKSWSCENCQNWQEIKDAQVCGECYWAFPEAYNHMALRQLRRTDVSWVGEEVAEYDVLKGYAEKNNVAPQDVIKQAIKDLLHKLKET